jgi:hypothetical protein
MLVANRPLLSARPGSPFPAISDRRSGLGATTSQEISTIGGSVGSSIVLLAAPALLALGPLGIAIGGGIMAVTAVLGALGVGNGCGGTCVQASNDANQIEVQMKANLAAYLAGNISQAEALSVFDQLWARTASETGRRAPANGKTPRVSAGTGSSATGIRSPTARSPVLRLPA